MSIWLAELSYTEAERGQMNFIPPKFFSDAESFVYLSSFRYNNNTADVAIKYHGKNNYKCLSAVLSIKKERVMNREFPKYYPNSGIEITSPFFIVSCPPVWQDFLVGHASNKMFRMWLQ